MPIVEIVCVGREILDGRVIETNSIALAKELARMGLTPRFKQCVDDQHDRMIETFKIASQRADLVLVTGGLGPTSDDITSEVFAKYLNVPLLYNEEAMTQISERLKSRGREISAPQKKQAQIPQGCFVLKNEEGTAPGFGYHDQENHQAWFFMPGVPREMIRMFREQVGLFIHKFFRIGPIQTVTWATQFTAEANLQELLNPIEKKLSPGFELTYRTRFHENEIGLYAPTVHPAALTHFNSLCSQITEVLGDVVFSTSQDHSQLDSLESVVVKQLLQSGYSLATAESCTGGLVANRLTNIPGSSQVFWGSFVTYDNAAKEALGVHEKLILQNGAVSSEVARALAEACYRKVKENKSRNISAQKLICVSTTGICGPSGGSKEKPVGLCHIGLAGDGFETYSIEVRGRNYWDREQMKSFFAQKALDCIRRKLINR